MTKDQFRKKLLNEYADKGYSYVRDFATDCTSSLLLTVRKDSEVIAVQVKDDSVSRSWLNPKVSESKMRIDKGRRCFICGYPLAECSC